MLRTRRSAVARWADDVTALLTDEFDLDETAADVIRTSLASKTGGITELFEVICDTHGNWRLKPDPSRGPWGLRLADYRLTALHTSERPRADRVTAALAAIETPR